MLAVIVVIAILCVVASLFITFMHVNDQDKLTEQISEILLERVKDLLKENIQPVKQSTKRKSTKVKE